LLFSQFSGSFKQTCMANVCVAIGHQSVVAGPEVTGLTLQVDAKSCRVSTSMALLHCAHNAESIS